MSGQNQKNSGEFLELCTFRLVKIRGKDFLILVQIFNEIDQTVRQAVRAHEAGHGRRDDFRIITGPRERAQIEEILSLIERAGPPGDHETEFAVEDRDSILERTQENDIVTDDNMITEWPRIVDGTYEF